ncbi:geranylgeranylglycerol-phosphate geranylgeranyltransferase [Marixanthomonas sp. SCSIO 43207]|uniref:geranylgeranylglycerol-phosphate geranylgeranyltransferase n=1 Tax=Marixanthomonas sp. SCSIO 43207 TaxID=2779360 RepID=UPI001CA8F478|nr:geranylgeranylglycerol-phosphate geranylgeranyltransferase [Marixanthomonas sp. SCSIO 43207]UAB82356.1 geranylgeranylglycerol-phosphate geranylgeranyltransferase [Marixanthomonas sp. SCSIO 43207]
MLSRKQKHFLLKVFSLFSVVRGYNILIIVIAQYLTSIYILAPDLPVKSVLLDVNLLMLVLASAAAIASGYIINSFYDSEKDLINRPRKTMLDRLVSQRTKLSVYFILNFVSVVFASYVSFRAVLFFSMYIFVLWLYSHKLKKYPFIGNVTAAILAVIPFFAVFIYYRNFDLVIFVHATFLFLLISMRELVKDLENIKGDLAQDYHTIPVVYGEQVSKRMLTLMCLVAFIPALLLIFKFPIGYMSYFFFGSILGLLFFLFILWKSKRKLHYIILHNILKFIIVLGVFSIVLIDIDLLVNRFLLKI